MFTKKYYIYQIILPPLNPAPVLIIFNVSIEMTLEESDSQQYHQGSHHPLAHLSKYGINREPPRDDSETYPSDDTHSFFAKVLMIYFLSN